MSDPTQPPVVTPAAPPTQPGAIVPPARRPVWPTVLAVITIVLGSVGILQGGSMLLMPLWHRLMGMTMPPEATEAMEVYGGLNLLLGLLMICVAALLLAGGIGLARRRRWSVPVLLLWAGLKMPLGVFNAILTYLIQQAQFESMSGSAQQQVPAAFTDTVMLMSFGGIILWTWALPVFLLVWLTRRRVRAEIAGWERSRPGPGRRPPAA